MGLRPLMEEDFRRVISSGNPLKSFSSFLQNWWPQVEHGLRVAHSSISSSGVSHVGEPRYHGTHFDLPVYYQNGEIQVMRILLTDRGFLVQSIGSRERPKLIPFDNPQKGVREITKRILFGGNEVRGYVKRLSGRYGSRGR